MYNYYYERIMLDKMIIEELIKKNTRSSNEKLKKAEWHLIKDKRVFRNYLKTSDHRKQYRDYKNSEIVGYGGTYDSGWMKILFKGERWSKEEKEKFIRNNWRHRRFSAYDCTGDIFTWGIDVFNVPSGVVVYIREGKDI